MAVSNVPVLAQTPRAIAFQISTALATSTAGGTASTFYVSSTTSGVGASKITAIWASNSDSVAHNIQFQFARSGVNYGGMLVQIPGNSGFSTVTPPLNVLTTANWPGLPTDGGIAGLPYLFLASTLDALVLTYATTLTTGTVINIGGIAKDF
jgi:hypothetical protein